MAKDNLKIIIPMAGYGTRLRPHTWSKPKPLVSAAGKPILGHVIDSLATAPDLDKAEITFIVGFHGEQVRPYMEENYAQIKAHYYAQEEMNGQSPAIALGRQHLHGPTIILFVDTIADIDFGLLRGEKAAVTWVKEVEDPRRFGVAVTDGDGRVRSLVEKPDTMENKLALIGCYYFPRGEDLLAAIDRQIAEGAKSKGEYYLVDAVNILLRDGLKMRAAQVNVWLDAGVPATVLDTNRYLLDHGRDNSAEAAKRSGVTVLPPIYLHPGAQVEKARLGPHVSVGAGCVVKDSEVKDSVLEPDAQVVGSKLRGSLVGMRAQVRNVNGMVNIGDDAVIEGYDPSI